MSEWSASRTGAIREFGSSTLGLLGSAAPRVILFVAQAGGFTGLKRVQSEAERETRGEPMNASAAGVGAEALGDDMYTWRFRTLKVAKKSPKSSYVLQARSVSRSAALFSALTLLLAFYCTATHSLSPILISAPPPNPIKPPAWPPAPPSSSRSVSDAWSSSTVSLWLP
jgi:hypothetical protein